MYCLATNLAGTRGSAQAVNVLCFVGRHANLFAVMVQ
jgi:hypothetical protein